MKDTRETTSCLKLALRKNKFASLKEEKTKFNSEKLDIQLVSINRDLYFNSNDFETNLIKASGEERGDNEDENEEIQEEHNIDNKENNENNENQSFENNENQNMENNINKNIEIYGNQNTENQEKNEEFGISWGKDHFENIDNQNYENEKVDSSRQEIESNELDKTEKLNNQYYFNEIEQVFNESKNDLNNIKDMNDMNNINVGKDMNKFNEESVEHGDVVLEYVPEKITEVDMKDTIEHFVVEDKPYEYEDNDYYDKAVEAEDNKIDHRIEVNEVYEINEASELIIKSNSKEVINNTNESHYTDCLDKLNSSRLIGETPIKSMKLTILDQVSTQKVENTVESFKEDEEM